MFHQTTGVREGWRGRRGSAVPEIPVLSQATTEVGPVTIRTHRSFGFGQSFLPAGLSAGMNVKTLHEIFSSAVIFSVNLGYDNKNILSVP